MDERPREQRAVTLEVQLVEWTHSGRPGSSRGRGEAFEPMTRQKSVDDHEGKSEPSPVCLKFGATSLAPAIVSSRALGRWIDRRQIDTDIPHARRSSSLGRRRVRPLCPFFTSMQQLADLWLAYAR
uniref:Uncharacterized protein n=1 Tax=Peronospora matthiolae TaxID=2874970 RepID=A0AAV1TE16_9STRA